MPLSESDTRAKLIDPAIHRRGWTEDLIRREETAGAIEVGAGGARRRPRGRVDYVLRVKVTPESQPVAVALIEAKAEHLAPTAGLEQAKLYGECRRMNVPFVFACNGRLFVEYDRFTGHTAQPRSLTEFPTPAAPCPVPGRRGDPTLLPGRRHPRHAGEIRSRGEARPALPGHWGGQDIHRGQPAETQPRCVPGRADREPAYEYDMAQGIVDGYLAACEIPSFDLFHDSRRANERETGVAGQDLTEKRLTEADPAHRRVARTASGGVGVRANARVAARSVDSPPPKIDQFSFS
jgi:type I restriction enzyme R subunit